jgi:hypothetical protein
MSSTIFRGGRISFWSTGIIGILLQVTQFHLSYFSELTFTKRTLKQWCETIVPKSTKRTITSHHNSLSYKINLQRGATFTKEHITFLLPCHWFTDKYITFLSSYHWINDDCITFLLQCYWFTDRYITYLSPNHIKKGTDWYIDV